KLKAATTQTVRWSSSRLLVMSSGGETSTRMLKHECRMRKQCRSPNADSTGRHLQRTAASVGFHHSLRLHHSVQSRQRIARIRATSPPAVFSGRCAELLHAEGE